MLTLAEVGAKLDRIENKINKLLANLGEAVIARPLSLIITAAAVKVDARRGVAGAEKVKYYRIMGTAENGGNFTQSGINVYPEVLEAAGIPKGLLECPPVEGDEEPEEMTRRAKSAKAEAQALAKLVGRTAFYTEAPSTHKPGTFSRKVIRID
jgi:hypothetical protein